MSEQPSRQETPPVMPAASCGQTASAGPLPLFPFRLRRFVPVPSGEGTNPLQQKGKNNMNKVKDNPEEPKAAPMYQNQVRLVGFLGKDPEHRENRAILSLATKTSWQAKDSDKWESHTEWHRIVVWDKLSEAVKPLAKGDYVLVEGELRSGEYERDVQFTDGNVAPVKHRAWEIRARAVRKLARKKKPAEKPAKATKDAA
jgi:single stranded DNA-binding protein